MEMYIFIGVILMISLIVGFALPLDLPSNSPDTLPDDEFSTTCKKYSTKEIAEALDEIGDDV